MHSKNSHTKIQKLPILSNLKNEFAINKKDELFIKTERQNIYNILSGNSKKTLLIVGPCSIHDIDMSKKYALKLKELAENVSKDFKIVMRIHTEKPRTRTGWKGFITDPLINSSFDINLGIKKTRELLIFLAKNRMPASTEFLDPLIHPFIEDLISLGGIGARTVESPIHRQIASSLNMPVIFKNSTDGDIKVAINAMLCAQKPQYILTIDDNNRAIMKMTEGNQKLCLALRGSWNKSNYDHETILDTINTLKAYQLNCNIIIDCAHGNSFNSPSGQAEVFDKIITETALDKSPNIKGIIVESFIKEGSSIGSKHHSPDISITDPCLSWETTKKIIEKAVCKNI